MSVSFPLGRASERWAVQANQAGFSLGGKEIPRHETNSQQTVPSEYNTERPPAARQELILQPDFVM